MSRYFIVLVGMICLAGSLAYANPSDHDGGAGSNHEVDSKRGVSTNDMEEVVVENSPEDTAKLVELLTEMGVIEQTGDDVKRNALSKK